MSAHTVVELSLDVGTILNKKFDNLGLFEALHANVHHAGIAWRSGGEACNSANLGAVAKVKSK